jgi:hypothetical protein
MARTKASQITEETTLETSSGEELVEIQTPPMNGRAVGTAIDPTTGTWVTVVLEFNPATGHSRISRTVPSGNSKLEAAEKFKILAVEEGVVV